MSFKYSSINDESTMTTSSKMVWTEKTVKNRYEHLNRKWQYDDTIKSINEFVTENEDLFKFENVSSIGVFSYKKYEKFLDELANEYSKVVNNDTDEIKKWFKESFNIIFVTDILSKVFREVYLKKGNRLTRYNFSYIVPIEGIDNLYAAIINNKVSVIKIINGDIEEGYDVFYGDALGITDHEKGTQFIFNFGNNKKLANIEKILGNPIDDECGVINFGKKDLLQCLTNIEQIWTDSLRSL